MPVFVDKLAWKVKEKSDFLRQTLKEEAEREEVELKREVVRHWHPLPSRASESRPAFAVDGSLQEIHLANGALLFIAQALFLGENFEATDVDVEILRGTVRPSTLRRFSDLFRQNLEVGLAQRCLPRIPRGSILFLDGALYGQLPQLYPLHLEGYQGPDLPRRILDGYLALFQACAEDGLLLIAVAKSSHEAILTEIIGRREGLPFPTSIPDSEAFTRWTKGQPGFSTPVVLGRRGFGGRFYELLESPDLKSAPAIVSFFVRLLPDDDVMRVDVPACCLGLRTKLADVEEELAEADLVRPILEVLRAECGGYRLYNTLLHSADRQVRLDGRTTREVYLRVIERELGCRLPVSRGDKRFL